MTPKPPSSSEGSSLPPRHRPNMGNLAKDTTEMDLWAFDDLDPSAETIVPPSPVPPMPTSNALPAPRDPDKLKNRMPSESSGSKSGDNQVKVNVTKPRPLAKAGTLAGQTKPGRDFDDLDSWDESEPAPEIAKIVPEIETASVSVDSEKDTPAEITASAPAPAAAVVEEDEFSPVIRENSTPVPLTPRLNLSSVERIGLVALVALLLVGGVAAFLLTIHRLPTESQFAKSADFPIQGKHFTILSAESHWRTPQPTDTVRRGTQLLPVVKFKTSGGPGAIRVIFRDSNGETVGDTVIRSIKSAGDLEIGATAGFDDVGMHAAYRTGLSKPWTIEVSEAPSENTIGTDFKKLFVTNISTDRR